MSDWIEQLAFGRTTPKLSSCLGLYLGPDGMVISQARVKAGKPVVDQLVRVAAPAQPSAAGQAGDSGGTHATGALNTEFLSNPALLADALAPAIKAGGFQSRHLVVSLAPSLGLLRYFVMPVVDRRYWNTAIPAEAKKYVPLAFSDLVHDFHVRTLQAGAEKRPRLGVLFGVTYRAHLLGIQALAQKLGLTLLGVEVAACSVERLWDQFQGASVPASLQVHFEGRSAYVLVSDRGWPILFREAHFDGEPRPEEARKVDLGGCLDFSKKQLAMGERCEVRLSGPAPRIDAWKEPFAQETGLAVHVLQETLKKAGLKTEAWGGYASIGAALELLAPSPFSIDLTQARQSAESDRKVAKTLLTASALLTAWFLLLSGGKYADLFFKYRQYQALRSRQGNSEAFQNKTSEQIRALVEDTQKRVDSFGAFARSDLRATYVLEDIAAGAPDSLWMTQISYANISGSEGVGGGTLNMTGHVRSDSVEHEQDLAARFGERLKSNRRFAGLFDCNPPAVQANTAFGGAGGQEMTTFSIECRAKK